MPSLSAKMKIFSILAKNYWKVELNFSRMVLFHMKIKFCLKYFLNDVDIRKWRILFDNFLGRLQEILKEITNFIYTFVAWLMLKI